MEEKLITFEEINRTTLDRRSPCLSIIRVRLRGVVLMLDRSQLSRIRLLNRCR